MRAYVRRVAAVVALALSIGVAYAPIWYGDAPPATPVLTILTPQHARNIAQNRKEQQHERHVHP